MKKESGFLSLIIALFALFLFAAMMNYYWINQNQNLASKVVDNIPISSNNTKCIDSDNGRYSQIAGNVKYKTLLGWKTVKDYCTLSKEDQNWNRKKELNQEYQEGSRIIEGYCNSKNTYALARLKCPAGTMCKTFSEGAACVSSVSEDDFLNMSDLLAENDSLAVLDSYANRLKINHPKMQLSDVNSELKNPEELIAEIFGNASIVAEQKISEPDTSGQSISNVDLEDSLWPYDFTGTGEEAKGIITYADGGEEIVVDSSQCVNENSKKFEQVYGYSLETMDKLYCDSLGTLNARKIALNALIQEAEYEAYFGKFKALVLIEQNKILAEEQHKAAEELRKSANKKLTIEAGMGLASVIPFGQVTALPNLMRGACTAAKGAKELEATIGAYNTARKCVLNTRELQTQILREVNAGYSRIHDLNPSAVENYFNGFRAARDSAVAAYDSALTALINANKEMALRMFGDDAERLLVEQAMAAMPKTTGIRIAAQASQAGGVMSVFVMPGTPVDGMVASDKDPYSFAYDINKKGIRLWTGYYIGQSKAADIYREQLKSLEREIVKTQDSITKLRCPSCAE